MTTSTVKINMSADPWKVPGGQFVAKKGNRRGGCYTGGQKMDAFKAKKEVVESMKNQGMTVVEINTPDGYCLITGKK